MQISEDTHRGAYYIRSYTPGEFYINDKKINHSILLTTEQLIDSWAPKSFAELSSDDFNAVIEFHPEIFLLGTGERLRFPSPELLAELYKKQIGVEVMDTAAACRTYNLLMSEDRRVAAGLLIK